MNRPILTTALLTASNALVAQAQAQRQPENHFPIFRLPFWSIHHKRLRLLPTPLRPAERSILFSETSVRLSDGARSATSSHAPKKGCGVREVCIADLYVGVAFLLLTFL